MKTASFFKHPWTVGSARVLLTLLVTSAAVWAGLRLWDHYEVAPWTRDGRVRANIVQIAPDVSGLVTAVPVADNQAAAGGTLLFEVDRARFCSRCARPRRRWVRNRSRCRRPSARTRATRRSAISSRRKCASRPACASRRPRLAWRRPPSRATPPS